MLFGKVVHLNVSVNFGVLGEAEFILNVVVDGWSRVDRTLWGFCYLVQILVLVIFGSFGV